MSDTCNMNIISSLVEDKCSKFSIFCTTTFLSPLHVQGEEVSLVGSVIVTSSSDASLHFSPVGGRQYRTAGGGRDAAEVV